MEREPSVNLALAPAQEADMDVQTERNLREFINLHHEELTEETVGKITLFGDYVAFCREHGYSSHSNMVQFCRECARTEDTRVH